MPDDWDSEIPPPIKAKGVEKPKGTSGPVQRKWKKRIESKLPRLESSIFPKGYVRGTNIGLIGVPGSGKTRFALQECLLLSDKGYDCIYLHNESNEEFFDMYIEKIARELNVNINEHLTLVDMSDWILKTAQYDQIETFIDKFYVQQPRYWLKSSSKPGFIVLDSFSTTGRRYIPQLFETHESWMDGMKNLYSTLPPEKRPVLLEVHQKSGSNWERDNDSVVGGFSVVHQLDADMVFRAWNVNKWDAQRYNLPEGKMVYFVHSPKDRFGDGDFEETQLLLKNGKITLGKKISELIQAPTKQTFVDGGVDWQ